MSRTGLIFFILAAPQFFGVAAYAESSLDALENELNQTQQEQQSASSEQFTNFLNSIDQGMQSPTAAVQLYQSAGGGMPAPAPVYAFHPPDETPDEQALRQAQDQAVVNALGSTAQLHCGLIHFAALFAQNPNQKGLATDWVAWLKQAAPIYLQTVTPPDTRTRPPIPSPEERRRERERGDRPNNNDNNEENRRDYARELKTVPVRDSLISAYFHYHAWGEKEQGSWRVQDVPRLYRTQVLDPLRAKPDANTVSAWDAYIAMMSTDELNRERWNNVVYPGLLFQRDCDDFYATPGEEKLTALVELIKNNSGNADAGAWITQVKQMIKDYRTFKSTGVMPPPAFASANASSATPDTSASAEAPDAGSTPAPSPDATSTSDTTSTQNTAPDTSAPAASPSPAGT
ncbi:MAG TPA: hypothetical protein VL981_06155 [Candidatus Methylacidiphilales bacterium]|nr:hypothetical protein [Candidatus Methylacidiphilales bacterium]